MRSTEKTAAAAFHASCVLPLARLNARERRRYLALGPETDAESYWEAPISRSGGVAAIAAEASDAPAMLRHAASWWTRGGDGRLASLLPDLLALREALLAEPTKADDGEISISVYPLF